LLTKTAKVVSLSKFKGEPSKLKEFITKLQIHISYNNNSFDDEAAKVLFTISYLERLVFDFIEVYLDDYNVYTNFKEMRLDTRAMLKIINKFIKIIKKVYKELYKEEKAT